MAVPEEVKKVPRPVNTISMTPAETDRSDSLFGNGLGVSTSKAIIRSPFTGRLLAISTKGSSFLRGWN